MPKNTNLTLGQAKSLIDNLVTNNSVQIEVIPQTGDQWTVNWYALHRNQNGAASLLLANAAMTAGTRVDLILQPDGHWTVKSY